MAVPVASIAWNRMILCAGIGERLGIVRLYGERAVVVRDGLLESFQPIERVAAIVQGKGMVGIYFKRGVYLRDGCRIIAALLQNDAKQVQAAEMIGPRCQNSIINFLGVCQSAGLMQR